MNSIDRKVLSFRDKVSRSLAGGWGDLYEAWNEYLLHLNLLSFLLASACAQRPAGPYYVFECREIQKFDVARITFENDEPKRSLWYGPELKSSALRRGKIESESKYEYDRPSIPVDIFDELFSEFVAVISVPNAVTFLQPIMKAYFEYIVKNNHLALTLSWTAIEMYLFKKYRNYLEKINQTLPDGSKRINASRKKVLSGTNVPVARVIEYLEIHGEISLDQYNELNRIRKIRNKIIHGGHTCSSKEAKEALKLALDAFQQETAIKLTVTNHDPRTTGL